jgi:hypothetical protein
MTATLTFDTAIWVPHLLLMLLFECYTYFYYCPLSATLTFNAVIWVLHLLLLLQSKCNTQMTVLKVSVALKWQYWKKV